MISLECNGLTAYVAVVTAYVGVGNPDIRSNYCDIRGILNYWTFGLP
jgi:hypothetical protein